VSRRYRIRAFAAMTGVTVKALLHYDRLGLLRPPRTTAGHRLYADADRERLEQIVALKFLGLPLRQIRQVLNGHTLPLAAALGARREALAAERERLDRGIAAILSIEEAIARGHGSDAAVLTQLTSLILRHDADAMRQYFSDAAWEVCRDYFAESAPSAWSAFYDDVSAALDDDPCGDRAEALLWRMYAIMNEETHGDLALLREVTDGMTRAYRNREDWPVSIRDRFDNERMREISGFLRRVSQMVFLKRGPDLYRRYRLLASPLGCVTP
jgi:DNA-binding transcriptional MerR regulator